MMQTPEALEARTQKNTSEGGSPFPQVVNLGKGAVTPEVIALKGKLTDVHWEFCKEVLDIAEILAPSDRQWTVARRKMMDYMTAHLARQRSTIVEILVLGKTEDVIAALQERQEQKEIKGNGTKPQGRRRSH